MIKVRVGEEWLQTYKKHMVEKEALCESMGVIRTRGVDILAELKAGMKEGDSALRIKEVIVDKVLDSLLQVLVEIRDIEPLESRENHKQGIVRRLMFKNASEVEVKSLRAAPWDADGDCYGAGLLYLRQGREHENKNWLHYSDNAGPP